MIDANLPRALAALLRRAGHEAVHVSDVAYADAVDSVIARHATALAAIVITKDVDFVLAAKRDPSHPRVLWVRTKTQTKAALRERFARAIPVIEAAFRGEDRVVEIVIGKDE